MQKIDEKLLSSFDLVRLEIKEAQPLPESYIAALKHLVGGEFDPRDLFFNSTCLITTDIDDAHLLVDKFPNAKVQVKFESEYFGFGFYFINFIDNKQLMALIGGIR